MSFTTMYIYTEHRMWSKTDHYTCVNINIYILGKQVHPRVIVQP